MSNFASPPAELGVYLRLITGPRVRARERRECDDHRDERCLHARGPPTRVTSASTVPRARSTDAQASRAARNMDRKFKPTFFLAGDISPDRPVCQSQQEWNEITVLG